MLRSLRGKRQTSDKFYKKLLKLTIGGGAVFYAITIVFSLTPFAAEFRAALSISYVESALIEPFIGGTIISCCLSYFLLRFFDKIPTKNPILKSVILSLIALGIVFILLGVAASRSSDAFRVIVTGAVFNLIRFPSLGIVIGYLCKRLYGSA